MDLAEDKRQAFLINRDGVDATAVWYRNAAIYYKRAANKAIRPRQDNEAINCARGPEYHQLYLSAALDCLTRHRRLSAPVAQR